MTLQVRASFCNILNLFYHSDYFILFYTRGRRYDMNEFVVYILA